MDMACLVITSVMISSLLWSLVSSSKVNFPEFNMLVRLLLWFESKACLVQMVVSFLSSTLR